MDGALVGAEYCMTCLRACQAQLLGEISRYAQRPMDRFSKDLRSGQQAKVLAFEILGNLQGAAKSPHARLLHVQT